jgi:hypothetical protein
MKWVEWRIVMFCFLLLAANVQVIFKFIITVHRCQHIHWKNLPIYSCRKYVLSTNGLRKLKIYKRCDSEFNILLKNKYNQDKLFISLQYRKYKYGAVSVRLFIYIYVYVQYTNCRFCRASLFSETLESSVPTNPPQNPGKLLPTHSHTMGIERHTQTVERGDGSLFPTKLNCL